MLKKEPLLEKSSKQNEKSDSVSQFILPYDACLDNYFTLYRPPSTIKGLHLNSNDKLLSEEQINVVINFILKDIGDEDFLVGKKYPKKIFNAQIPYSVIAVPIQSVHYYNYKVGHGLPFILFAEYWGIRRKSYANIGEGFVDKWAQDLYSSKWVRRESIIKKTSKISDNVLSMNSEINLPTEVQILKALDQYYGHVERENDKGKQTILLRAKKGEITLEKFLNDTNELTMQQALSIGLQLLKSYRDVFKLGALHRNISPSNIAIKPLPGGGHAITFIHWWSGILVRKKTDKNGHYNPSYSEKNIYGDPRYVGHDIAIRLLENSDEPLKTAKDLARFNTRLVRELILDKNDNNFFLYTLVERLIFRLSGNGKKNISYIFIEEYILPLIEPDSGMLADLLAETMMHVIRNNIEIIENKNRIKSKLTKLHHAFATHIQLLDALPNYSKDEAPPRSLDILYDEKSEIHQLAGVIEVVLNKTKKKCNTYIRGLVLDFIKKCQVKNRDDKPSLLNGINEFQKIMAKYDMLHPKQLTLKNVIKSQAGYLALEQFQHFYSSNMDLSPLKKYKITFISEKKQTEIVNNIEEDLKKEGVLASKKMLVRENPFSPNMKKEEEKPSSNDSSTMTILKKLNPSSEILDCTDVSNKLMSVSTLPIIDSNLVKDTDNLPSNIPPSASIDKRKELGRKLTESRNNKPLIPSSPRVNPPTLIKTYSTSNFEKPENTEKNSKGRSTPPHRKNFFLLRLPSNKRRGEKNNTNNNEVVENPVPNPADKFVTFKK